MKLQTPKISFVIPAHNEEAYLDATLTALHAAAESLGEPYEVVVVDDDSTDRTVSVATRHGARTLMVNLRQIGAVRNAGAREAKGDMLFFLDADTILPAETLRLAWRALRGGAAAGGARVSFDESQPLPLTGRIATTAWNCLSRTFRWAAGCCVFTRRDAFEAVGGFDERFFAAEEIVLSHALHRRGPFTILPRSVTTSARKITPEMMSRQWLLLARLLLTAGRAIRQREGLNIWYEPSRKTE